MTTIRDQHATPASEPSTYRAYRAPKADGSVYADPGLGHTRELLQRNLDAAPDRPAWLLALRQRGRHEMIEAARKYTSAYRDVSWSDDLIDRPIMMSGHQPSLFHPGVWFKNFALSELASRQQCLPINLVVDNDVCSGSSLKVPVVDAAHRRARYEAVPFDRAGGAVPYEQWMIGDRGLFLSFGKRVAQTIAPLVPQAAIDRLWPHAIEAINRCGFAGCALAQARHALEAELGQRSLEIPVGVVCRGQAFAEFVLRIVTQADRYATIYNAAADEYRAIHGIRSKSHPVPNLSRDGDWIEVPLWVYSNQSPGRQQVWMRRSGDQIELGDRKQHGIRLRVPPDADLSETAAALRDAITGDFKLRPRALLTTMFARLVLSDLFLHGIGGGKYDQLGDVILRRFFGFQPPAFMVLSATILLPDSPAAIDPQQIIDCKRRLRATRYHGERFADQVDLPADWIRQKRSLLDHAPSSGSKRSWHQSLDRINRQMADHLAPTRAVIDQELATLRAEAASRNILRSREHSFALHPLDSVVETFAALLDTSAATH